MYPGLQNELMRIITTQKFKLTYSSNTNKDRQREQFTLYNNDKQIVAVIRETRHSYTEFKNPDTGIIDTRRGPAKHKYMLILDKIMNCTTIINNQSDIKKLYELCVSRKTFEEQKSNIMALDFLKRQR